MDPKTANAIEASGLLPESAIGCKPRVLDRVRFNDHASMYRLDNGLIIHREDSMPIRTMGWKYTVHLPGASPSGFALLLGGADTLRAALDFAAIPARAA